MGFYGGAYYYYINSYIGVASLNFSFDYLSCNGSESQLNDCFHVENSTCNTYEGVYIYCDTTTAIGNKYYINVLILQDTKIASSNYMSFISLDAKYLPEMTCDNVFILNETNMAAGKIFT